MKKTKYWLPKNRYFELKYLCMQYNSWKHALMGLDSVRTSTTKSFDPVPEDASQRERYLKLVRVVENAAFETDPKYGDLIFKSIVNNTGYHEIETTLSKDRYFELYQKFFYILEKELRKCML